ncbi:unnamed protein product [Kuraishia capsulata CBS 1993]|uniref:Uncharacterized protein n=1 Tax=Kuraishia capsulata CBS 1993 TaxID=1382522 RepID=W6MNM5_9ASCO|nr:uncharacterized protein KUCA_T00004251001 [Kuraishia capsulata CBS 1993]CDK28269.1 unnamed protein product [Kuraishia capsulata CBS 1993]
MSLDSVDPVDPVFSTESVDTRPFDANNIEKEISEILKEDNEASGQPQQQPQEETAETSSENDRYGSLVIPEGSELLKTGPSALDQYRRLMSDSSSLASSLSAKNENSNPQLAALPLNITSPADIPMNAQLLINTIPVLDNLATQILRTITQTPYETIMEIVSNRDSLDSIAFSNLVELFEVTKRVYNSEDSPFFTVENVTYGLWKYGSHAPSFLRGKEQSIESTLRKVNLATFLNATLGMVDMGFFFLNEAFLDVFCPPQGLDPAQTMSNQTSFGVSNTGAGPSTSMVPSKLLKQQAILFLDLKTQAFISAIELGDRSKEEIVDDLFPSNLDETLIRRREPQFDFQAHPIVRNATMFTPAELVFLQKCESRKSHLMQAANDESLLHRYEWLKFLADILDYVSKNVGFLIWGSEARGIYTSTLPASPLESYRHSKRSADSHSSNGVKRPRAASSTVSVSRDAPAPIQTTSDEFLPSDIRNYQYATTGRPIRSRNGSGRMAWSKEEENALREGIKACGTQWSAILSLYGPGGTLSEALKNRTALQLKDKARNWKVFYLRYNLPLPEFLVTVTGDLERDEKNSRRSATRRPKMLKSDVAKSKMKRIEQKEDSNIEPELIEADKQGDAHKLADSQSDSQQEATSHDNYDELITNLFRDQARHEAESEQPVQGETHEGEGEEATAELKNLVAAVFGNVKE